MNHPQYFPTASGRASPPLPSKSLDSLGSLMMATSPACACAISKPVSHHRIATVETNPTRYAIQRKNTESSSTLFGCRTILNLSTFKSLAVTLSTINNHYSAVKNNQPSTINTWGYGLEALWLVRLVLETQHSDLQTSTLYIAQI